MERRYDATLKSLLEDSPDDWPRLLGVADPNVRVIDADISTISGAADKVLRLHGPPPSILHFEFQSGPDASIPCDLNLYLQEITPINDADLQALWQAQAEQLLTPALPPDIKGLTGQFLVLVTCRDEKEQIELLAQLQGQGRECKALLARITMKATFFV
jgi:hypothetical protein